MFNKPLAICDGDSGGPVWITRNRHIQPLPGEPTLPSTDNGFQYTLVAVISGIYEYGKIYRPQCSTAASVAVKLTDDILDWIHNIMR